MIARRLNTFLGIKHAIAKLVLFIVGLGFNLCACSVVPADFSKYANVNLIAGYQFDNAAWVPDEAAGNNMDFVSAGTTGYTPAGILLTDLQTALSTSAAIPIYRLETKNLFINGDLENGAITFDPPTFGTYSTVSTSAFNLRTGYNANNGNWLSFSGNNGSDLFALNLATHVTDFSALNKYSLSFVYYLDIKLVKVMAIDNATADSPSAKLLAIQNPNITAYRFPFSPGGSAGSSLELTNTLQYLYFNSTNSNLGTYNRAINGSIDDIQLVRSDLPNAVRLDIPWVDTAGVRPDLHIGGHYTVSFWVRRDLATNYSGNAAATPNRFDADFVSVSLHQNYLSTNQIGPVVVHSVGSLLSGIGINHPDFTNWTQITATFNGPAQILPGLQIAISATNLESASGRTPGSILIANPSLNWSPN